MRYKPARTPALRLMGSFLFHSDLLTRHEPERRALLGKWLIRRSGPSNARRSNRRFTEGEIVPPCSSSILFETAWNSIQSKMNTAISDHTHINS